MFKQTRCFYEFGPFRLDSQTSDLWAGGELVALEPKVADTLLTLVQAEGQVVEKATLVRQVWGAVPVTDNGLTRNIYILRKTLGKYLNGADCIDTVPTRGYRFTLPVTKWPKVVPTESALDGGGPLPSNVQQPPDIESLTSKPQTDSGISFSFASAGEKADNWSHAKAVSHSESDRPQAPSSRMRRFKFAPSRAGMVVICMMLISAGAVAIRWLTVSIEPTVLRYTQLSHDERVHSETLLTDGLRIYFEENVDGKMKIAEVPINGGEIVQIPTPFSFPQLNALFPGGSALLVTDHGPRDPTLWKIPLPGGSPQPFARLPSSDISLSRDGHKAAYTENEGRILVVANSDGGSPRTIYSISSGWIAQVCWSPNDEKLSFQIHQSPLQGKADIFSFWSIRPDGSNLRVLIPPTATHLNMGCWTPDGKYFIFDSIENAKSAIWAMRADNMLFAGFMRKPVRLTSEILNFSSPLVSLDGTKIFALGKQDHGQLVRYDRKSGYFLPYLDGISVGSVDFTRDGNWVAYVAYPEGTLWRSRVNGQDKLQLTFSPLGADSPHWSPDGERIAYRASMPDTPRKIFLISKDGGVPEELRPTNPEDDGIPTWSPTGDSLVFGDLRFHPEKIAIHIMDLKNKKLQNVPGSEGLWTPRWSPDGRFLLALKADAIYPNSKSLLLFDFQTQRWKTLIQHSISEPVWSHDSKYIYFDLAGSAKDDAIFRIRVADGMLEQVTSLGNFARVFSYSFGNWFGLAPDDSPLLLREARQTEIYALDMRW